ncbi:MAG: glycerol-3-phosphate dehydrogenase/oxidase [Candidatus Binataceae bacterium]
MVGAGINGAALARDASMRGLRVALFDRGDFAGETSSRSSKLIHGGFRYLPQRQFRLVYGALRERERLRRITAPHLVHPIRFVFPIYCGRGFGRITMAIGLTLYDLIARIPRAQRHRNLDAKAVTGVEPLLSRDGLSGGAIYYDATGDDARLTVENVLDASLHGAAVANYLELSGFTHRRGRLAAVRVRDLRGEASFELRARVIVNATGPWVDAIRRLDEPGARPCVRLTKGVHLVFSREALPVRESLVLSDHASRIVFVIPDDRYVLVGTTDTDFDDDPSTVATTGADVGYLLGVLRENLPTVRLSADDVLSSFAGLRALVTNDGADAPSSVSREEVVLESASGLITIAGGKLTTHREIAEKLGARVMRSLGRPVGRCPTLGIPLPGARALDGDNGGAPVASLFEIPQAARDILVSRYGTRAALVASLIGGRPDLARPLSEGCPAIGAEVVYAVRSEMAQSLADFLVRRTALVWRYPREAEAAAPEVARLMAAELGWSSAHAAAELAHFREDLSLRRIA